MKRHLDFFSIKELNKIFCFVDILLVILLSSILLITQQQLQTRPSAASSTLLPGQQIWKNGVSSYLFGAVDTAEWVSNNIETSPGIQQALKAARFTLMRTFFSEDYRGYLPAHKTTDAEITQRLQTIENSNMTCLGVLPIENSAAFDMHVISFAGSRCNIYEFGNEPDYEGIPFQTYLQMWNTLVPQLRKVNPNARFLGPAVSNYNYVQDFLIGVKASKVLPDAITFHYYPCLDTDSSSACLAKAASFAQVITQVKDWTNNILGLNLPVGITEWNFNQGNPPPSYSNNSTFMRQFTIASFNAMIQAGLDFANEFDVASGAGYGGLDMFNVFKGNGQPKPQYYAIANLISQYKPASAPGRLKISPTAPAH